MSLPEELPRNAIVLGGAWEKSEPAKLSIEARMRVSALGLLAQAGLVDTAILSGGMINTVTRQTEDLAMCDYLAEQFPGNKITPILDADCHDTPGSARSVARRLDDRRSEEHAFITSYTHMPRALKWFRKEGVNVTPVVAETVLQNLGDERYEALANGYLHSRRYYKRLVIEAGLRTVMLVDRNGTVSNLAAGGLRQHA